MVFDWLILFDSEIIINVVNVGQADNDALDNITNCRPDTGKDILINQELYSQKSFKSKSELQN